MNFLTVPLQRIKVLESRSFADRARAAHEIARISRIGRDDHFAWIREQSPQLLEIL